MKKPVLLLTASALIVSGLLGGCSENTDNTSTSTSVDNPSSSSSSSVSKPVTITHLTWRVADVGDAFDIFKEKFENDHPNITLDIQNVSSDQYYNTLQTRLLSGDPPDIITTQPEASKYVAQVENGYLMDITNEAFLDNLIPSSLSSVTRDSKIYGIPYDTSSLVVFYNKKIFADAGVSIPTSYPEFLKVCETLKSKEIVPISYGIKDVYVTAFLPYQIAPTKVYAKNSNWDSDLVAGKAQFLSDEWRETFSIPFELNEKGYMTSNALGIGDQQSVEVFARGEAAMTFTGTWATSVIRAANPDIDLGLFPFPANDTGEDNMIVSAIGQIMAISASTKNPEACKTYLGAWTDITYAQDWNNSAKSISTVSNVSNDFDASINDLTPYLESSKTWSFAGDGWPAGVQDAFRPKFQEVWSGQGTVDDILKAMDEAAQDSISN